MMGEASREMHARAEMFAQQTVMLFATERVNTATATTTNMATHC